MAAWQEEVIKRSRQREWRAFYLGIATAAIAMSFGAVWFVMATGGFTCPI